MSSGTRDRVVDAVEGLTLRVYRILVILRWLDMAPCEYWSLYSRVNKEVPISTRSFKLLTRFLARVGLIKTRKPTPKTRMLYITEKGRNALERARELAGKIRL